MEFEVELEAIDSSCSHYEWFVDQLIFDSGDDEIGHGHNVHKLDVRDMGESRALK